MTSSELEFHNRSEVWSRNKNNALVITASGKRKVLFYRGELILINKLTGGAPDG